MQARLRIKGNCAYWFLLDSQRGNRRWTERREGGFRDRWANAVEGSTQDGCLPSTEGSNLAKCSGLSYGAIYDTVAIPVPVDRIIAWATQGAADGHVAHECSIMANNDVLNMRY